MGPYESMRAIEDPQNGEEAYLGSFTAILSSNLGRYVICEFLIGTQLIEAREGILYFVGNNYLVLYQQRKDQYIICDLYSLKFVTFINPDVVTPNLPNLPNTGNTQP